MENLRKFRLAKGLTQEELAVMVEITASSISQYENGKKTPSFENALKIAEALDCEVADLISERGNITPEDDKKTATNNGDGIMSDYEIAVLNANEKQRKVIMRLLSLPPEKQDAFLTMTEDTHNNQ